MADWEPVGEAQPLQNAGLDVVSPAEGKLRQDSGGYLADGTPSARAVLVDQDAGAAPRSMPSAAPSAQTTWTPDGAPTPITPQPMSQMPTPQSEANYQQWVQQNRVADAKGNPTGEVRTPGMGDRSVTVDPYGNGVDVDLRSLYSKHAMYPFTRGNPLDQTQAPQLDPTPQQLNQYATPNSGRLTKDSIFAAGQPASNIGSWDTDDDGKPVYREPGWTPATRTQQAMKAAAKAATGAAGLGKEALDTTLDDFDDQAAGIKRAASNAGDFAAQTGKAFARGTGASVDALNYVASLPGGVPWMYDSAKSLLTGKDTTEAEDWLRNGSTYFASKKDAYAVGKSAGLSGEIADAFGETGAAINQALLMGPAKAIDAGATAFQGVMQSLSHTALAAVIPASTSAVNTGRDVYAKTGDLTAAVKAAQAQYLVSTLQFAAPMNAPGKVATRIATGAAIAPATAEVSRQAMNAALPESMQSDYDTKQSGIAALTGGAMAGAVGGHSSARPAEVYEGHSQAFDDMNAGQNAKPNGGLPAPESDWSKPENQYADLKTALHAAKTGDTATAQPIVERAHNEADAARAAADASPKDKGLAEKARTAQQFADYLTTHTGIDPRADAPDTSPRALTAPERRAETEAKTDDIATKAADSGEITTEHGPTESHVNVADVPVHSFDTKGAAESAAEEAKTQVDARRTVGMSAEEKADTLETHADTGIPNRLAYDNAYKQPVQAAIEADSLGAGAHPDDAKQINTAVATALHDEAPGHAFHLSGNKFVLQAPSYKKVNDALAAVRERLAATKLELTGPQGHTVPIQGIGISHGTGPTLDAADSALQSAKPETSGIRAAAEDEPGEHSEPVHQAGVPADEPVHAAPRLIPRPTKLYRGTETGKAGLKRESSGGELGRAIYATPHKWLAESYGGGPKARVGKGREVHEIEIPHMPHENYGYVHGGSKVGERAELRDHEGNVLHTYDGASNTPGHGRDDIRRIADERGMKMLVGMPESIAHNQVAILDHTLIKDHGEVAPEAQAPKAANPVVGEHALLGHNSDGEPVFVDKHGIRSVVADGIRTTESVGMIPTRQGIKFERSDPDDPRYQTGREYDEKHALQEERAELASELQAAPTSEDKSETIKRIGDLNVEIAQRESPAHRADMTPAESTFVDKIGERTLGKHGQLPVSTLVQARKLYEEITGTKLTATNLKRVDELVERAIVETARSIVGDGDDPKATFQRLVKLYERQPSLNTRTSTSIENQAYSTPAPLAFVASDLAGITRNSTVLEPTAGNGMLLIAADPAHAIVNELNDQRAASLKAQGFDVTQRDAADQVLSDKPVDVVIANPPFGVVRDAHGESKSFTLTTPSGKAVKTNEIDHAIVLKQLETMKPDGRAVLLIGGVNKLAKGEARSDAYNGAAKRKFFYHLYNNYNVVDHFTVSGDLYSRQGAAWPIDVIVVHGTGKSSLQLPAASVPREYNDYPALEALLGKTYDRVDAAAQAPASTAGGNTVQPETEVRPGVVSEPARGSDTGDGGRLAGPEGSDSSVARGDVLQRPGEGRSELPGAASGDRPGGGEPVRGGEVEQLGRVPETGEGELPDSGQPDGAPSADVGQGQPGGRPADVGDSDGSGGLGAERAYKPKSKAGSLDTLVPANMEYAVNRALEFLETKVGPIDDYVAKQLGYNKGELGKYFGAEQVDALGLAIHQISLGKGFIIGDQTGIGKGRVVAGIIRYALKNGHTPIFVTEKPNLYGDIVRDLRNIGQDDIRPLMTNAGEKIPVESGGELKSASAALHNKILQRVVNEAKLADHNMLFTTYSQIQVQGKRALRHEALDSLVPNAIMILDESHNAGGTEAGRSNKKTGDVAGEKTGRAALVRGYVGRAKGVFYSSATYAKRPSVMDLYSKTDMSLAVGGNVAKLPGAIAAGGVPLQQVVASQLSDAGQYLRRERSFKGVDYNTPTVPVNRDAAETLASIMLAIKEFDDKKAGAVAAAKESAKAMAQAVSEDGSKGASGAQSTNFTSSMHNLIGQMLLGLKADKAASMAVEALKRGEKPVITVANTMGSFIEQYAEAAHLKGGDRIGIAFNDLAKRYLEASRFITIKDIDGNKTKRRMSDEELGPEAVAAFNRVKKIIEGAKSIGAIPISPIDYIHKKLKDAGYTSTELTGRTHTIEYRDDGEAIYRQRGGKETSAGGKVKSISDFNNGKTDAMILNQSGASGLSLHASSTFKNQNKRNMIIAQAEGNIDTHMQILGRVHRTGQVVPPEFNQLVADIPAEKRPAAVLAKKMASLSANTTGARSGNFTSKETVDFLNSYGDEVAAQLMADMPEVHEKLGEPLDSGNDGYDNEEAARKVTGRIPMLPVQEQEELYNLLESGYRERLAQADAMGENALEAKTLPLDAKPLKKVVLSAAMSGDSPFAAASHAETMDVKRVGKPYTSADVRAIVAKELGVEGEPSLNELADRGRRVAAQTMQDTRKDFQEYRNGEEAKMLASEQKEAAITGRLVALDGVAHRWQRVADLLHVGGSYEFTMPDNSAMMGVVTEVFKKKGVKMPVALGSWAAKIALADGSKQMTVPFSKVQLPSESVMPGKIQVAPRLRNPATGVGIEKMFDDGQSVSRENRVIITGNLLAGFSHIKGGQVIHFTDNKGEVRQGIMMPRSFKLDEFVENAPVHMPPDRAVQFFTNAQQGILKSADGAVTLARWGNEYAMNVAKSKAEGGKYFLDAGLRQITGDFVSVGTGMRAMLNKDQVPRALEYIQRKFEQRFDTTTFRQEALAAGGTSIGTEKAKTASMARDEGGEGRVSHASVQAKISGILDKFGTKFKAVHIFPTAEALFESKFGPALYESGERPGSFKAFVTPDGQYVAASDQFHSLDDVAANVAHEFLGHYGARAMYGGDARYQRFLDAVAEGFPSEMKQRGEREYHSDYDPENTEHRNKAAEEVAAYFAQRYANSQSLPSRMRRLLDRLFQIMRDFARSVLGLPKKFDNTWLKGQIAAFERYMRGQHSGHEAEGEPAFQKRAPTFYSAVERAVESGKRDKGTGAEWEATLRNTPGVKADELKWLDLKGWLEGRGRVTRAEVADYVRAHKLELGEVWHGSETNDIVNDLHKLGYLVDEDVHGDPELIYDSTRNGQPTEVPDEVPPEVQRLFNALKDADEMAPKYRDRSEPGGKNYRELLLTLPSKDGDALERNTEQLKQANEALRAYGREHQSSTLANDPALFDLMHTRDFIHGERTALMESRRKDYRNGHWDEPNIVAHVRFDDRAGPNGEKVLHVAEVQSDWHQAGRKHGYRGDAPLVPAKAVREDRYWRVTTADGEFVTNVQDHDNPAVETAEQAVTVASWRLTNQPSSITTDSRVPDAPFKTTWPDLVMKRMLRHAAEGGYDALSWDTGDTNAARYNMGNEVDSIRVSRVSGAGGDPKNYLYDILATRNGRAVVEREGTHESKLSDLLGKDMAQKAISAGREPITFKGEDLKIGGAGMRGFYDDMLPKKVQALTKKWGGHVENVTLPGSPELDVDLDNPPEAPHGWENTGLPVAPTPALPAHMIRITDAMREGVLDEGQPQFARNSFARDERPDFADALHRLTGREEDDPQSQRARTNAKARKFAEPEAFDETQRGHAVYELLRKGVSSLWTNKIAMEVRELVNPKDVSAMSKRVAATTMPYLGALAQQQHQTIDQLQQFSRAMDRLSPADLLDIDDDIEHGRPQRNPQFQPMADALRKLLDDWAGNVRGLGEGHLENLIANYLPHIWRDADKAKEVFASAMSRRPMRGPATFLKKRTIPTLREGIALGLQPLTLNPLILTFLKVAEMQKFVAGVTMMRQYKEDGLARFLRATEQLPEGWEKIDDPIARVSTWSEAEGGFVQRGFYIMPTDGARIINNHLSASKIEGKAGVQVLKALSNSMISFQLGFSLYHAGFTSNDALVSKMALGVERLAHGEPLRAAAAFLESLSGPYGVGRNIWRGLQLKRAYLDPQGATPEMQRVVAMLTGADGSISMDRYYQAAQGISPFRGAGVRSLAQDIKQALSQPEDKVAALTKTMASFPAEMAQSSWRGLINMGHEFPVWRWPFEASGRMVRATTSFIMETLVPLQKLGVASDLFRDFLRRNPHVDPVARNLEAQSIWRSVDNRLGEIVYDNKFWNRLFKLALHLGMRAVGWKFGDVEEIGGAATDTFKVFDKIFRPGPQPNLITHKIAYTLSMYMMAAIMGAVTQYLWTGEAAKDFQDLMFPRTGRKLKDGTPERANFPNYVKDVYEATHHPLNFVKNAVNPVWPALGETISGKDWKDQPYLNPNESALQSFFDRVGHFFGAGAPMSMTKNNQFVAAKDPNSTPAWKYAPQIGVTPAPSYITKPQTVERQQHERDEKDYQKVLTQKIRAASDAGDKAEVQRLIQEQRALYKSYGQDRSTDAAARKAQPPPPRAKPASTSALMDHIGPLLDQGGSRAVIAQRVHDAGYPALAGLLGSMPETLRPQVRIAIERVSS